MITTCPAALLDAMPVQHGLHIAFFYRSDGGEDLVVLGHPDRAAALAAMTEHATVERVDLTIAELPPTPASLDRRWAHLLVGDGDEIGLDYSLLAPADGAVPVTVLIG